MTREEIFKFDDRPTEKVPVPEWNNSVITIRAFSAADRDKIETEILKARQENTIVDNLRARIAVRIIVDEKGERMFADEDAPFLAAKSAKALDRIFDAHVKLNGMSQEEKDDYEKNS